MKWSITTASAALAMRSKKASGSAIGNSGETVITTRKPASKDYIPIERVNEWVTGFGSGSNAFVLLHGFVNCQDLKLTANRKSIANTDPRLLEDLRSAVQSLVTDVDEHLQAQGLYTLRSWQDEERTSLQERAEFERRVRNLKTRRTAILDSKRLLQPTSESELFGLFVTLSTLRPELFPFEPLDYNTNRGVDVIARNRGSSPISDGEHWYVELKFVLQTQFNHSFKHLRYIVCWDFDDRITHGTEFRGIGDEQRKLTVSQDADGKNLYFLDAPTSRVKIQIIRLKEHLANEIGIGFEPRPSSSAV
jgi:hypothetical protein